LEESANKRRIGGVFSTFPSLGVLIGFVVIVVLAAAISPGHSFIRRANIEVLLSYGPEFTIIVLGVGLLMICGEFDLSVGSTLVLSSFVFAWLFGSGINPFIAALVALAVGAIAGLLNGLITVKGRIPSFVTTLGTMMFWRGLTLMVSGGFTRPADTAGFPVFTTLLTGELGDLFPVQAAWFVLFAVLLGLLLHLRKFGNWIYATGDNKEAARAMGINTDMVKILSFILVGLLCAFVAVTQTVRVGTFSTRAGEGWELRAIAAAVVGRTSLRGGVGDMTGIFLGALIIVVIENALALLWVPHGYTYVVFGLVIVLSVLLDMLTERRRMRYV
jgi:simple sugar transport system permease protein